MIPNRLSRRAFVLGLLAILSLAAGLRFVFPAADPPWNPSVGIVWHDEGAWVHNARNKALFGAWAQDAWNPMYIAPVFTGLEYAAFSGFGVGVRQARLVPALAGLLSVGLLALGVRRLGGRHAGLIAGALLATNYVYLMWNRAALMEGPMIAFMVASWYCYVRAQVSPRWGWLAALCALLAFFTKAAAAFFVAALGVDAVVTLILAWRAGRGFAQSSPEARAARATLTGLVVVGLLATVFFVLPNWTDYRFYNWQMSVVRKPSYTVKALIDRLTWFPILHDIFTRMWFVVVVGVTAAIGMLTRLKQVTPGERLLLLWVGLGALELLLHDVGNERRFVFFVPPLVALAALVLGRDGVLVPVELAAVSRRRALLGLPLVLYASYVVAGAIVRLAFLYEIRPNVRLAGALALGATALVYATWPRLPRALSNGRVSPAAGLTLALVVSAGWTAQFGQWAIGRTYKNYDASRLVGSWLEPGTLVHGKLANGLALENTIRPIFVGRGFGNYDDRKTRDDVRYILTYVAPSLGYESQRVNPVIGEVIDAYPAHRVVATFDVAETATGHDRAALIDKFGTDQQGAARVDGDHRASGQQRMDGRAQD